MSQVSNRRRIAVAVGLCVAAVLAGLCAVTRPDKTVRVATGLAAHTLCSETFVSGMKPDEIIAQSILPFPGVRILASHLTYRVDRKAREVRVDWHGLFAGRAVYRERLGCLLVVGHGAIDAGQPPAPHPAAAELPAIAGPAVVAPADPRLRAALDRIFTEPANAPYRWIKAVVVVKDGRIIAERYAPGIGIGTKLLGYRPANPSSMR